MKIKEYSYLRKITSLKEFSDININNMKFSERICASRIYEKHLKSNENEIIAKTKAIEEAQTNKIKSGMFTGEFWDGVIEEINKIQSDLQ